MLYFDNMSNTGENDSAESSSASSSLGAKLKGFFTKNQGKLDAIGKSVSNFWKDLTSDSGGLSSLVGGTWRSDSFSPEELGITYITKRLLLMPFPSEEETSMGRPIEYLSHYLDTHHRDQYMIWNLSERQYDTSKFHNQVIEFSFPGYPAPPLHRAFEIVKSIAAWLDADPSNVAVVHCQTGTGRSAVSVASYLAYLGYQNSDCSRCLEMIAMACGVPVTSLVIPTQRRYLNYVTNLLAGNYPSSAPIVLERVIINTIPDFERGGCRPYLQIFKHAKLVFTSIGREKSLRWYAKEDAAMLFPVGLPLEGDIIIRVRHLTARNERVSMLRLGFHAGYIRPGSVRFPVIELDSACADDRFSDDFWVDLVFRALRPGEDPTATAKSAAAAMLASQANIGEIDEERAKAVTAAAAAAGKSTSLVGAGLEPSELARLDARQYWSRLIRNSHASGSTTARDDQPNEAKASGDQPDSSLTIETGNATADSTSTPVKLPKVSSETPNAAARAAALAAICNSPEPTGTAISVTSRRSLGSPTGTGKPTAADESDEDDGGARHIRFRFDSDDEDGDYLAPVPTSSSAKSSTSTSTPTTTPATTEAKTEGEAQPKSEEKKLESKLLATDLNAMLANLSEELGVDLTSTALDGTATAGSSSSNSASTAASSSSKTAEEKNADAMLADLLGSIEGLEADDVMEIALRGNVATTTTVDAEDAAQSAEELLKSLNLGDELP